jgi:hypothetical protein
MLSVVTGVSGSTMASVLKNFYLNPTTFSNSRLLMYSQMYEKFLFKKFTLHWQPTVATSTQGGILIAYDKDISDASPPTGDAGLRQYWAWSGTRGANTWEKFSTQFALHEPDVPLFCSNNGLDMRWSYQGQVYVVDELGTYTDSTQKLGIVFIEYEIDFYDPQLEPVNIHCAGVQSSETVDSSVARSGWNNVQTVLNIVGAVQKISDAVSGAKGLRFPPGTYEILEALGASSAHDVFASQPTLVNNGRSNSTITYVADNGAVAQPAGGAYYRVSQLKNDGPDTVDLYGNVTGGTSTWTNHTLQINQLPYKLTS